MSQTSTKSMPSAISAKTPELTLVPESLQCQDQSVASLSSEAKLQSALQIPYEDRFDLRKMDSLKFLVQVIITIVMLSLCVFSLHKEEADKAIYWGGITGVIAWWMPSPGSSKAANSGEKDS
jgi:hypothetical protein